MLKRVALILIPAILFIFGLISIPKLDAAGTNLIDNPSVEIASGNLPANWGQDNWGTNTETFSYKSTGAHSGSHSLYLNMTKWSSGDAKWYFRDVTVQPNHKYTYSEFYKSNVATEIDIQYTSTANKLTYGYLNSPASSPTAWNPSSVTFTTPANVKSLTIFHLLDKVGWLQTDDFSLVDDSATPPATTPPSVSFSAPASGATVSGKTQQVSANAGGTTAIAGVQFKLDNNNLGAEDTAAPYSVSWDTTTVVNGTHTLSATARNTAGQTATTTETVTVNNVVTPSPATSPAVSITTPAANAIISGSQTVSATASDAVSVASVQFKLDGTNLDSADTTSPYSVSWNTTTTANGLHSLTAVATNASNLTTTSSPVTVDVENLTAPTIQIISPLANSTITGTQALTANAASAQGVASVQFKLNGNNLGSPLTSAPYTMNWDSNTVTNGSYSLTAVVTDKANLTASSAAVVFVVSNQAVTPPPVNNNGPNLIANPSLETSSNGTSPDSWLSSNWGTNTSAFSYLNTGHTGSHSVMVQTTSYTNGAANWYYNDIPVTAGATYQYTNWYQSNVDTEVDAEAVMSDGTTSYFYLGAVPASPTWNKFTTTFTPPTGTKSIAIYQILAKVGYIISDDYSLNSYTPTTFNRGIVTLNFDDGWLSQYTNGVAALQANNLTATFFIITDSSITNPDPQYMNANQIIVLKNDGYEIGNHTETHPDLTTLTTSQVQTEMGGAESALQSAIGVNATDFAYPYGAYNSNTVAIGKQVGFISQRSVNSGFNTKDNLDLTQLKIEEVDANITPAQVQAWVNQAIAQKTWLILVYHEIDTVAPAGSGDNAYLTSPANLNSELSYIKSTGVAVETTAQAINEILPQL